MRLFYVAGPYRGRSEWRVEQNIRAAESAALELWEAGAAVFCPHKNTAHFGGALADYIWLDGGLIILSKCDAVYVLPDYQDSSGTLQEIQRADALGIPVFYDLELAKKFAQ